MPANGKKCPLRYRLVILMNLRSDAIEVVTWNHPVIADGKLFVRNAEEAACYALPDFKAVR